MRAHKKEASAVAWHPVHEGLITTGGSEGSLIFWLVGEETVRFFIYLFLCINFLLNITELLDIEIKTNIEISPRKLPKNSIFLQLYIVQHF